MAEPITMRELASRSLAQLSGVGPKREAAFAEYGVNSLADLLSLYPRRYVDRTRQVPIDSLEPGEQALVVGTITSMGSRRVGGRRTIVTGRVSDGSASLGVTFFNQAWRERQLPVGTTVALFGKVESFRGMRQLTNPLVDLLGNTTGRVVPLYPQSERSGVSSSDIGALVEQTLRRSRDRGLADPLPEEIRDRLGLCDREHAVWSIHMPETLVDTTVARQRLVFDELLRIQLALVARRREFERTSRGIVMEPTSGLVEQYLDGLGFPVTCAQRRVINEIQRDMARLVPMHRLLQGDVGSGKTVVAVAMMLTAVAEGAQGALMAPTEVLAEQHVMGLRRDLGQIQVVREDSGSLFAHRPLRVELMTQRIGAARRRVLREELARGEIDIVVGTQALIQEGVRFARLGAVIIDEQHRFGVEQRDALRVSNDDGTEPHVLVMTATPIPRTAAMTVYGDLDVSVLDEMPPGRVPVATFAVTGEHQRAQMWEAVRAELRRGHQAYVVCPLVADSEKIEAASAEAVALDLGEGELAGFSVALMHGRMASEEKEQVMTAFREGSFDVLVATTVIEVGVDVANATVMVLLDAGRFVIAQLPQLRGRVGRSDLASKCYLESADPSPDGSTRIEALVRTSDGFELAEVDLELRGEGTIMNERQKGRSDLKLASLRRDAAWVLRAREVAIELIDDPRYSSATAALLDEVAALLNEDDAAYLSKN